MRIKINCTVCNSKNERVQVVLYDTELDEHIEAKAKAAGIEAYSGRTFEHYSPQITSVEIED